MKNRFFTIAFGVLFVYQLARFLLSIEFYPEETSANAQVDEPAAVMNQQRNVPFYKRDFPLSQYYGLSNTEERDQRKADLEAECAGSSHPASIRDLNPREKSVLLKHIIVSDKHKFLYCYVPKVACSNWKRVVMVLNGVSNDFVKDHPYGLKYLSEFSSTEIEERLQTYTKFAFVRNPLERLLSAYRNKFGEIEDVMRTYGVKIKKKYGTYKEEEYEGKIPGDDVSFEEFIRYLIDTKEVEYMNEHWAPMSTLCQPCLVKYVATENKKYLDCSKATKFSYRTCLSHFKDMFKQVDRSLNTRASSGNIYQENPGKKGMRNDQWYNVGQDWDEITPNYDFIGSYDNLFEDSEDILKAIKAPTDLHFPARQSFYSPTSYATTVYFFSTVNSTYLDKMTKKYSNDFSLFSYPIPKWAKSEDIYET